MAGDVVAESYLSGQDCAAEGGFGDGSCVGADAEGDGGGEAGGVDAPLEEFCGWGEGEGEGGEARRD